MSQGPNSLYWMVTINNPISNELPGGWPDVQYAVWQREKGAEGTEHLQVYVVFTQKKRRTWTNRMCTKAHWEARIGNHDQAKAYVTKEETRLAGPWEKGEEPKDQKGKRNDLQALKRKLDSGATDREIAGDEETFSVWAKYHKVTSKYRALMRTAKQRTWATRTVVYYGPPGIGKSSRALHEGGEDAFWLSKPAGQTTWWDGYCGQETVVIDEFYGWIPRDLMCRLCDRYPLNVETKGGSTPFLAKTIIITSNVHPSLWWPKVGLGAMERRLSGDLGCINYMATPWTRPRPERAYEELQPAELDLQALESLELGFDSVQSPPPMEVPDPNAPSQADPYVQVESEQCVSIWQEWEL